MNIRSLTRGDGVVIGAAVVLFIASFLDLSSFDCPTGINCSRYNAPNAWDSLGLLMSVYLAGIIAAALVIVGRATPGRKVVGFDLGQFGAALSIFAVWTVFWTIIDGSNAGAGLILGLLAAIALAGGAVATPLVPALKAPLMSASGPKVVQPPYGGQPQPGQGTATQAPRSRRTAASRVSRVSSSRTVRSPASRSRRPARRVPPRTRRPVTSHRSGSRCRWPARCTGRTVRRRRSPNWRPAPGTSRWSSAVRA